MFVVVLKPQFSIDMQVLYGKWRHIWFRAEVNGKCLIWVAKDPKLFESMEIFQWRQVNHSDSLKSFRFVQSHQQRAHTCEFADYTRVLLCLVKFVTKAPFTEEGTISNILYPIWPRYISRWISHILYPISKKFSLPPMYKLRILDMVPSCVNVCIFYIQHIPSTRI